MSNPVDNPDHYKSRIGVECIEVIDSLRLGFNTGNAMKYLWRHKRKGNPIEDLKKAAWYIDREIKRLERIDEELEDR